MSDEAPSQYERMGGRSAVLHLAERFYDIMERDEPALTALHECDEQGKVCRRSRDNFGKFLVFWLGGPDDYVREQGHPALRMRHAKVPIDLAMRDAWVRCMGRALDESEIPEDIRDFLRQRMADVADFLRNRPD